MNRRTQGALLVVAGLVALRLVWTGSYLDYVKDAMVVPLVATGVVLVVLGVTTVASAAWRDDEDGGLERGGGDEAGHGHDHGDGPKVAWLLVVPLAAVLLVAPAALGADAASRQSAAPPEPTDSGFPVLLEPVDGHVDIGLGHFIGRALYDDQGTLDGLPVRVRGFVVHDEAVPDGFLVARFSLVCCAADASVVTVGVPGQQLLPQDTWVEVEGTLLAPVEQSVDGEVGELPLVQLAATSVRQIEQPRNPYE